MTKVLVLLLLAVSLFFGVSCRTFLPEEFDDDDFITDDEGIIDWGDDEADPEEVRPPKYSVNNFLILELFLEDEAYGERTLPAVIQYYADGADGIANSDLGKLIAEVIYYTKNADSEPFSRTKLRNIAADLNAFIDETENETLENLAEIMLGMTYSYIVSRSGAGADASELGMCYDKMKNTNKTWIGQFLTVMTFGNTYLGMRKHWAWRFFMPGALKQVAVNMRAYAIELADQFIAAYEPIEPYSYYTYDFAEANIVTEFYDELVPLRQELVNREP